MTGADADNGPAAALPTDRLADRSALDGPRDPAYARRRGRRLWLADTARVKMPPSTGGGTSSTG
jgi:hypothetical protein